MTRQRNCLALSISFLFGCTVHAADFDIKNATVLAEDHATMRIAADLLRRDLLAVGGGDTKPASKLADCREVCIVVGRHDSPLLRDIAKAEGLDFSALAGKWEQYERIGIASRTKPGTRLLLIAGSDVRGAVFGAVDVTRELGVSAWEWWADVKPKVTGHVAVRGERIVSAAPSVRYRGIFLNDEDWGLQPWAAQTFDPAKDIGPATYARIFELLWRLKANLIWPAMHDSTKPFYQVPGNAQAAKDYAIVVGTSHAEPMMRNNVREWKKSDGPFNFFTNRDAITRYWQRRVNETTGADAMYTMGIRGVHDSAMEGADTIDAARAGVTDAIAVQRKLLADAWRKPLPHIAQALTLYKEVLDIYNSGLQVPDDITLVWPDDNYGYLHQLGNPKEAARGGGNGLYYHISYWGRPHDYLWLATTAPGLIRDQLQRAVATRTDRVWVVNVGDIKPAEYLTQYFLDAAFDRRQLDRPAADHMQAWFAEQFGAGHAPAIAGIMREYYALAWERKPEYMGFSQTEPTTPTRQTDYMAAGGEEAEQRLARYEALDLRAQAIGAALPADRQDAFFQLVQYPVRASANLNARILRLDLAAQYARMGRPSAQYHAGQARNAQDAIAADTAHYNALAGGKWRGMMDAAPRRLPVFLEPVFPAYGVPSRKDCDVAYPSPLSAQGGALWFTRGVPETKMLTVIQYAAAPLRWTADQVPAGLRLSTADGALDATNGYEQRIAVTYDGKGDTNGLRIGCGDRRLGVRVQVAPGAAVATEHERIITLPAATAGASAGWAPVDIGSLGTAQRADLALPSRDDPAGAPALSFAFHSHTKAESRLRIVAVPVHALTSGNKLRIAVSLDDAAPVTLDFGTVGRSDEWKRNVLSNTAVRTLPLPALAPGAHTLRVHALDPGFVLDRIEVVFDGAPAWYGVAPGARKYD
ncbi:glycosyl hydrolase 115 family protein [Pseudoduganella lutea]|uniref:glycosyl hydrolase 115 family protein n=1 Tax=Pseudoduganella lutea TaxID=321985 RepID=UPI0013EECC21|nr:glycosyl hydrolase 115 family protein [Pseudoduganella lutea]